MSSSTVLHMSTTDGLERVADAQGDPSDPSALLFHGGGQTRHAWGGALGALASRHWYAASFDLPGHGDSAWLPDGNYDIDRFARAVADVANQFHHPVLVGASLGGLSSLVAVGEGMVLDPAALVLVDVTPRLEREGVTRIGDFMRIGSDIVDGVTPGTGDGDLGEATAGRFSPPLRLHAASRRVKVPTLLVRGGSSDVVSAEGAAELRQLIPHAEIVDVAGAEHMVAGDRNDRFNDAVIEFLERVVRGGG